MVSPTYMVEQCLEKRPEFYLEYVTLSSVLWLNVIWKVNIIFIEVKNISDWVVQEKLRMPSDTIIGIVLEETDEKLLFKKNQIFFW